MKYTIFDSLIRVLLRISLLQCMEGQSHKIGETLPGFTNSTAFMVMGMAYFCIDGAFSLKIGNSQPLIIV